MAAATGMMMGLAAFGAFEQSEAAKQQGEYQRRAYEMNARIAGEAAEDAILRGDKAAQAHKGKVKSLIGSQRAALAAQGIDVGSGSALDIQVDSAGLGAMDELTIKNNAWREAYGLRTQAVQSLSQARYAESAASNTSRNTLLTGGLQMMDYYQRGYAKPKGK